MFHPKMVNAHQSPEERRLKYRLARENGLNSYEAMMVRDWDVRYLQWFIKRWVDGKGYCDFNQLRKEIIKERQAIYYNEDIHTTLL